MGGAYHIEGERLCPMAAEAADPETLDEEADAEELQAHASQAQLPSTPHGGEPTTTGPERPREARVRRAPPEPTEEERARHVLTHLPFRSWRSACVKAKCRDNPHRRERRAGDMDEVLMDYLFMQNRTHADNVTLTSMVIVFLDAGAIASTLGVNGVSP